ncbi:transposase [Streptomyces sp. NPDC093514]|uniref:IS110 family transposase n=1 Tax=Streptomyces sp. NPDC093514 TaxID=3366039 RepID=UPI003804CD30
MLGAALDGRSFPATADGYRQLLDWARSFGVLWRAGVECTGSYGAALTCHLRAEGIEVTEVNQPDKAARRRHGKSDAIDAEAAARAVLTGRATAAAKTGDGPVEMLRLFKLAKGSATCAVRVRVGGAGLPSTRSTGPCWSTSAPWDAAVPLPELLQCCPAGTWRPPQ